MAERALDGSDGFTPVNTRNPPLLSFRLDYPTDQESEVSPASESNDVSDDELLDPGQRETNGKLTAGFSSTDQHAKMSFESDSFGETSGVESHTNALIAGDVPGVEVISNHEQALSRNNNASVRTPDILYGNSSRYATGEASRMNREREYQLPPIPRAKRTHCHMGSSNDADRLARNQLITVVVLCLLFMAGEAIGGALSNSLALFTDVLHLGSDLISFLISLLAIWLSTKSATKGMSFGYHRAEVLGALFSVFVIWLVSGVLVYMAIERIMHEHYKNVKPNEMLITASVGVAFNVIMGLVLHSERCCNFGSAHRSFGHNHSHGGHAHAQSNSSEYQPLYQVVDEVSDSDSEAVPHTHRHKNINVRAAFIHVLGDIIQSVGVLVAAFIIKFTSDERFRLADPICTFLFSVLVLITTITVLRDAIRVMMEGVPRDVSFDLVKHDLSSIEGVEMVHSLHLWSLTIDKNAVAVHLAINEETDNNDVLVTATSLLRRNHNMSSITVQVEPFDSDAMTSCEDCKDPKS